MRWVHLFQTWPTGTSRTTGEHALALLIPHKIRCCSCNQGRPILCSCKKKLLFQAPMVTHENSSAISNGCRHIFCLFKLLGMYKITYPPKFLSRPKKGVRWEEGGTLNIMEQCQSSVEMFCLAWQCIVSGPAKCLCSKMNAVFDVISKTVHRLCFLLISWKTVSCCI